MLKRNAVVFLVMVLGAAALTMAADNPWKDAKVGDWVKYENVNGENTTVVKWTVTAATETSITYEMETSIMGNAFKQSQTIDFSTIKDPAAVSKEGPKPVITEEEITVAGRKWKCKKIQMENAGLKTVSWICPDNPLGGLIKSEMTGTVSSKMTLVDYGPKK